MCGIIACRTHRPAANYLVPALRRLEYRGYDSVGIAVTTVDGAMARLRAVGRVSALETKIGQVDAARWNGCGIGHTRWATHGAVTEANAHPHEDCTGRIALVHNGIIDGSAHIRQRLTGAGHRLASTVDSEVLAHLIEEQLAGSADILDAVVGALNGVQGSWALAVLDRVSGRIVVASQRSPLLVAHTEHGDFAASDIAAIADWAEDFQVLEDGDVVELCDLRSWRNSGKRAQPRPSRRCTWVGSDLGMSGYTDHMAKEIDEQPALVSELVESLRGRILDGSLAADAGVRPFDRVSVVGCGTSLNAGRVVANLVEQLAGVPVGCVVASEAGRELPEPATLCIAFSQSGESADVLRAVDTPTLRSMPLLAITNNVHSTLARRADAMIDCAAGPEIGVAATKTFVCQIVAGAAMMTAALVDSGKLAPARAGRLVDDLCRLPEQLSVAIATAKCTIPILVEELSAATGWLFIARGNGLPYAAEGALKVKELTYRWAEHHPAGELKHGPLALVESGTPVVVLDTGESRLAATVAEVRARGGRIITIGVPGSTVPVNVDPGQPWGPLVACIPMQILARSLALMLGRDVDKPRNLAKAVTVE